MSNKLSRGRRFRCLIGNHGSGDIPETEWETNRVSLFGLENSNYGDRNVIQAGILEGILAEN